MKAEEKIIEIVSITLLRHFKSMNSPCDNDEEETKTSLPSGDTAMKIPQINERK